MNCNCNNNTKNTARIKHVFGNVLRLAIPLTLRIVNLVETEVDGETQQQAVVSDTDFIPASDKPVKVILSKGATKVVLDAEMRDGNIAFVEEKGKTPIGVYDITIECFDDKGNPYRFKQNTTLHVVDTTAEAGIVTPIEYEVTTWYLDAAIFLAMKGEDGVGVADIVTQTSDEIGGVNTVTIILTNGQTRSFTILNGSGSVDNEFSETSQHPISNKKITERFNAVDQSIADIFGDVDYDSQSKSIRFYNKGKGRVLATLDARPFIKDGMVNSAYISNNTLVITFNTDSGREAIGVPLTSVFNPNNYYNKVQVDNRIATAISNINLGNYYTKSQTDAKVSQKADLNSTTGRLVASQATRVVLDYIVGIYDGEDEPAHEIESGNMWYESGQIRYAYTGDVEVETVSLGVPQKGIVYCNAENNKTYRWTGSSWQQVGGSGSSSGGYSVTFDNGNVIFSGSQQPTYDNGNIIL